MIDRDAIRRALNVLNEPATIVGLPAHIHTIISATPELLAIAEAHEAAQPALEHRRAWLEARGLSEAWMGPMDVLRWVLFETDEKGHSRVCDTAISAFMPATVGYGYWFGWALCTPDQRSEALRIEALRIERGMRCL